MEARSSRSVRTTVVEYTVSNEVRTPWALALFFLTGAMAVVLAICFSVGAIFQSGPLMRMYPFFTGSVAVYGTFVMLLVVWCIVSLANGHMDKFSSGFRREVYSSILVNVVVLIFYLAYQIAYLQKYYGDWTSVELIPAPLAILLPPYTATDAYRAFLALYVILFFFFVVAMFSNWSACVTMWTPEVLSTYKTGLKASENRMSGLYGNGEPKKKNSFKD